MKAANTDEAVEAVKKIREKVVVKEQIHTGKTVKKGEI